MLQTIYRILDECQRIHPNNKVCLSIKHVIATMQKLPTLVELYVAVSEGEINEPNTLSTKTLAANGDHRIMHLIASSFKVFDKEHIYGVDFRDAKQKEQPASTVILGLNGIGKTTVYTALEMVAMRHSYVGDMHGYHSAIRQIEFVRNTNTPNEQPLATIVDVSGSEISYPGDISELCPKAFFCSQFDLLDLKEYQTGDIPLSYVLSQLGRAKLYSLLELLNDIEEITKKMNLAFKMHNELKQDISPMVKSRFNTQIKEIRKEIKEKLGLRKIRLVDPRWATDTIAREVSEVVQFIRNDIEKTFKEFSSISTRLIPEILNSYLAEDNAKVAVRTPEFTIQPYIVIAHSSEGIAPNQWLNTFRMKLFILAIKMSLAFTTKIIDKLNFPFVMDDVFDSSDFNNKFEIKRFIHSIVIGHDYNDKLKQMPLQIICFTQDRLIGDSIYEGILRAASDVPVKYCRMFHHSESNDKKDKVLAIGTVDYLNVTQLIAYSI